MEEKELEKKLNQPVDTNGDGRVSDEEHKMYLEFKRKELDDQDAMRDAQRKMVWFTFIWYVVISIFRCFEANWIKLDWYHHKYLVIWLQHTLYQLYYS